MANKLDNTYKIDSKIMKKILHDRVEYVSQGVFCEVEDACQQYGHNLESPIELALFSGIVAINFTCSLGDELTIDISGEPRNFEIVKSQLNRSVEINKSIHNKVDENDLLRIVIDYYDAGLITNIIFNQIIIENYRVDFLVSKYSWREKKHKYLAIECDGHDFHERTKEQAKKDRSRDRKLQELGFTVFRFTGSEIWADPMSCARQVMDWVA